MRLHRGFQGVPAQRSPNGGDEEEDGGKAIKAAERGRKAKPIRQPRRRNFPPFRICSPAWLTRTQDTARTEREKNFFALRMHGSNPGGCNEKHFLDLSSYKLWHLSNRCTRMFPLLFQIYRIQSCPRLCNASPTSALRYFRDPFQFWCRFRF